MAVSQLDIFDNYVYYPNKDIASVCLEKLLKDVRPKVVEYLKLSILSGNSSSDKFCDASIVDLTQDSVGNSIEEREDICAVLFSESIHSAILKMFISFSCHDLFNIQKII